MIRTRVALDTNSQTDVGIRTRIAKFNIEVGGSEWQEPIPLDYPLLCSGECWWVIQGSARSAAVIDGLQRAAGGGWQAPEVGDR